MCEFKVGNNNQIKQFQVKKRENAKTKNSDEGSSAVSTSDDDDDKLARWTALSTQTFEFLTLYDFRSRRRSILSNGVCAMESHEMDSQQSFTTLFVIHASFMNSWSRKWEITLAAMHRVDHSVYDIKTIMISRCICIARFGRHASPAGVSLAIFCSE